MSLDEKHQAALAVREPDESQTGAANWAIRSRQRRVVARKRGQQHEFSLA